MDNHHLPVPPTPAELTTDALGRLASPGPGGRTLLWITGLLTLLGFVGIALRLADGFAETAPWAYSSAVFAYLLTTVQGAPLVAVVLRLAKADWRRPISRVAELFALAGVLNLLLFLPLLIALPRLAGRLNLWMDWTLLGVDWSKIGGFLGMLSFVVLGLALLYFSAIPDFATVRDHTEGPRRRLYERLARGWQGTPRQWGVLRVALGIVGAFYFMFLVFINFLVSVDFSMSMIPHWWSSIYPAQQAVKALQGGVATVLVALLVMRSVGGLRPSLHVDQYWGLSKYLLALSLMWFYFWWSEFLTLWYGRTPQEQSVMKLIMFGPYLVPFFLSFFLCFFVPFICLIWNSVRKSILGPPLVSIAILVGSFFDRLRLYVGPWSLHDRSAHLLEDIPNLLLPSGADLLIIVGFLSGVVFTFLLGSRLIPTLALWEMREGLILRVRRRLLRLEVYAVGKPR